MLENKVQNLKMIKSAVGQISQNWQEHVRVISTTTTTTTYCKLYVCV